MGILYGQVVDVCESRVTGLDSFIFIDVGFYCSLIINLDEWKELNGMSFSGAFMSVRFAGGDGLSRSRACLMDLRWLVQLVSPFSVS